MEKKPVCVEPGCELPVRCRERCRNHYERFRRTQRDQIKPSKGRWDNPDGTRKECLHSDCSDPIETQGLCKYHYSHFHYMSTRGVSKSRRNKKRTNRFTGETIAFPCHFEGCENPDFNKNLCAGHYYQQLRGEELRPLHEKRACPVARCDEAYSVKLTKTGLCSAHSATARRFNLSPDRLIALLSPGVCSNPGCDNTERLHIDHDHACCPVKGRSCGKCVRAVLCSECNQSLGMLKENPRRIEGLLQYLEMAQAVSS